MKASTVTLILGNQLFPNFYSAGPCLMVEDRGIAAQYRYHVLRIFHQFVSMREFRDSLVADGVRVDYFTYPESLELGEGSFFKRLREVLRSYDCRSLQTARIPDPGFRDELIAWAEAEDVALTFLPSPQFLVSDAYFGEYLRKHPRPFMKTFYESVRKDQRILVTPELQPVGGQWSFDVENRKKLPKAISVPALPRFEPSVHEAGVLDCVKRYFADHPGEIPEDGEGLWIPANRRDALTFLRNFLDYRFAQFGPYEDAIDGAHDVLFHSALSPLINLGLLSPAEVVAQATEYAEKNRVPLASLEGFVRQVIGWREFVHGVHQNFHTFQSHFNFFAHTRTMKASWYDGSTGLPPVDDAIKKAKRLAYNHHIERLMILSNAMLLTELHPRIVHRWFMEMYLDSYEWVMGPNVYGMGQFSDGGVFATKPYISGSNYILKMSAYSKGDWCETWDGLYWSFIAKHPDFFAKNPRLAMVSRLLEKMEPAKKERLFNLADRFRDRVSSPGPA